jgi:hypothetical protein
MQCRQRPLPSIHYEARHVVIVCEPHCRVLALAFALATLVLCTFGNAIALIAVLAIPKAALSPFPNETCQITARTTTYTSNDTGNESGSLGSAASV